MMLVISRHHAGMHSEQFDESPRDAFKCKWMFVVEEVNGFKAELDCGSLL